MPNGSAWSPTSRLRTSEDDRGPTLPARYSMRSSSTCSRERLSLEVVPGGCCPETSRPGRPSTGGSGGGARMEPSSTSTPRYANECASVWGGTRFRAQVLPTPSPRRPQASAEKSVATTETRRCAAGSVTFSCGHRRAGPQGIGPQRQGPRPGRPEAAAGVGAERALAPFAPVAGRRLPGQGRTLGQGGDGFERGGGAQGAQAGA